MLSPVTKPSKTEWFSHRVIGTEKLSDPTGKRRRAENDRF